MYNSYYLALGGTDPKFTKKGIFKSDRIPCGFFQDSYVLIQDSLGTGIAIEEKWFAQFERDIQIPNEAVKWNYKKKIKNEEIKEEIKEARCILEEWANSKKNHRYIYKNEGQFYNLDLEVALSDSADLYDDEIAPSVFRIIRSDDSFKERINYEGNQYFVLAKYYKTNKYFVIDGIKCFIVEEEFMPTFFANRYLHDVYKNVKEIEENGKAYILFEDTYDRKCAILRCDLVKFEIDLSEYSVEFHWHHGDNPQIINHNGIDYKLHKRYVMTIRSIDYDDSDSYKSNTGEPDIDRLMRNGEWHDDML